MADSRVLWSGSTGFLGASAALTFANVNFSLPVPGVAVSPSYVAHLYFLFVNGANDGSVGINQLPTLTGGSGTLITAGSAGPGFGGPSVFFAVDPAWSGGGGTLTASYSVALSSFMGCLMGLIIAAAPEETYTLTTGSGSGTSSTASVTVTRPQFDYLQAGGIGGRTATSPSVISGGWNEVISDSRSFNTVFASQINLNAGMATYTGAVGPIDTTMSWSLGGSAAWQAHTTVPVVTARTASRGRGRSFATVIAV